MILSCILNLSSTRVYPNVSELSRERNENNKHSLRSITKDYGGKTHYTDSQNRDTIAPSGRALYHLQFSLQAASLETFGYTLILLLVCVLCIYVNTTF
jgi:hypothetical protein